MKKLDRNNKFGDFFLSEPQPSILQRMLFCLSYSQSLHRIEPLFVQQISFDFQIKLMMKCNKTSELIFILLKSPSQVD